MKKRIVALLLSVVLVGGTVCEPNLVWASDQSQDQIDDSGGTVVTNNWLGEKTDEFVYLDRYIGNEETVVVPTTVDNLPVRLRGKPIEKAKSVVVEEGVVAEDIDLRIDGLESIDLSGLRDSTVADIGDCKILKFGQVTMKIFFSKLLPSIKELSLGYETIEVPNEDPVYYGLSIDSEDFNPTEIGWGFTPEKISGKFNGLRLPTKYNNGVEFMPENYVELVKDIDIVPSDQQLDQGVDQISEQTPDQTVDKKPTTPSIPVVPSRPQIPRKRVSFSLLSTTVDKDSIDNWNYTISGTDIILTSQKSTNTELVVKGKYVISGTTYNTVVGKGNGRLINTDVTSIIFNKGVKAVGSCLNLFNGCSVLENCDVNSLDTSGATTFQNMFNGCSSLIGLDVSSWDTSQVTSLRGIFENCTKLKNVSVAKWNTSNVTSMGYAFAACSALESIDVSKWNTSKVTNIDRTFLECRSLKSLDVNNWDVSKVVDGFWTFKGCSNLENLDVSNWRFDSVTNISWLFQGCSKLKKLDVSNFNLSKCVTVENAFSDCTSLEVLDVSNWNTSKIDRIHGLFNKCSSLKTLDLSSWNMSSITKAVNSLDNTTSMKLIKVSHSFMEKSSIFASVFSGHPVYSTELDDWDHEVDGGTITLLKPKTDSTALRDKYYVNGAVKTVTPFKIEYKLQDDVDTTSAVTLDAPNGYTYSNSDKTVIALPTRPGYNFTGWKYSVGNKDYDVDGSVITIPAGSRSTLTAFAKWSRKTVTFKIPQTLILGKDGASGFKVGTNQEIGETTVTVPKEFQMTDTTDSYSNSVGIGNSKGTVGDSNIQNTLDRNTHETNYSTKLGNVSEFKAGNYSGHFPINIDLQFNTKNQDIYLLYLEGLDGVQRYDSGYSYSPAIPEGFSKSSESTTVGSNGNITTIQCTRKKFSGTLKVGSTTTTPITNAKFGSRVTFSWTPEAGYGYTVTGITGLSDVVYGENSVTGTVMDVSSITGGLSVTVSKTVGVFNLRYVDAKTTAPASVSGSNGSSVALDSHSNKIVNGYDFKGWNIGGTLYGGGASYTLTKDVVATAVYDLHNYTVTFNPNSGTLYGSTSTKSYTRTVADDALSINNPTRAGYTFKGWKLSSAADSTAVTDFVLTSNKLTPANSTSSSTSTIAYVAVWATKTYTIQYDVNVPSSSVSQVSSIASVTKTVENIGTYTLTVPTRSGYTFNGWQLNGSDSYVTSINADTLKNSSSTTLKYVANWTAITYTITMNANGGSVSPSSYSKTVEGGTLTFPIPTRTNYTFNGWQKGGSGSYVSSIECKNLPSLTTNKAVTYTANWTANYISYTATDYVGDYDGNSHSATLTVHTSGCTVTYGTSLGTYNLTSMPSFSAAGANTVYFKITKTNYFTATGTIQVINKKAANTTVTNPDSGNWNMKGTTSSGSTIQVTFGNGGFSTILKVGSGTASANSSSTTLNGVTMTRSITTDYAGRTVISYILYNSNSSSVTCGVSTNADIQIGSNDSAPIYSTDNGFRMSNGTYNFYAYFQNMSGVTNASGCWVGLYSSRTSYSWTTSFTKACSGVDSGMTVNWQNITVPAGSTKTITWMMNMV
jgi:uncharacterized repeat protein (TIGR02543 family)